MCRSRSILAGWSQLPWEAYLIQFQCFLMEFFKISEMFGGLVSVGWRVRANLGSLPISVTLFSTRIFQTCPGTFLELAYFGWQVRATLGSLTNSVLMFLVGMFNIFPNKIFQSAQGSLAVVKKSPFCFTLVDALDSALGTRCLIHNAHLGKIPIFLQNFRSKNETLKANIWLIFLFYICLCNSGLAFEC
jgi:hypothetical protein